MAKQVTPPNALPAITAGMSKKQITELARKSVTIVEENGNAEQVAEVIAVMDEFVKQVRRDERFVDLVREQLMRYNGSLNTGSGARIELCEAGITYDYSNDPSWRHLDAQIRELTEQKKKIEERLRSVTPGKILVDRETGEVVSGALKASRSTYRITLSKY